MKRFQSSRSGGWEVERDAGPRPSPRARSNAPTLTEMVVVACHHVTLEPGMTSNLWLCATSLCTLHQQPRLLCRCIGPKTQTRVQSKCR